jgi:hypothetical protein
MSVVGAAAAPKKEREYSGGANALCVGMGAHDGWLTTSQCAVVD